MNLTSLVESTAHVLSDPVMLLTNGGIVKPGWRNHDLWPRTKGSPSLAAASPIKVEYHRD